MTYEDDGIEIIEDNNKIEIIDDFLSHDDYTNLLNIMSGDMFPWHIGEAVTHNKLDIEDKYNWQLYHMFCYPPAVMNYDTMPILQPLYAKLNPSSLIKVKANCNFVTEKIVEHGLHIDVAELGNICTTAVYYLNSNNGYTGFEDGTKVPSVGNRLVKFPTYMKHTGTSCTDEKNRLVININYLERKSEFAVG